MVAVQSATLPVSKIGPALLQSTKNAAKVSIETCLFYLQCLLFLKALSPQSTAMDTSGGQKIKSVWRFPHPAKLESISDEIQVGFNGVEIARTTQGH
jgi:hypothetical protein